MPGMLRGKNLLCLVFVLVALVACAVPKSFTTPKTRPGASTSGAATAGTTRAVPSRPAPPVSAAPRAAATVTRAIGTATPTAEPDEGSPDPSTPQDRMRVVARTREDQLRNGSVFETSR